MYIGIVGSEEAKFTPETKQVCKEIIKTLLAPNDIVVSGKCHLGGVDIYAVEIAIELGLKFIEYPPAYHAWPAYRDRNINIARSSGIVYCITLRSLPPTYHGMRFSKCYHCNSNDHVKSGGCWTMHYAKKHGKDGKLIIINDDLTYETK